MATRTHIMRLYEGDKAASDYATNVRNPDIIARTIVDFMRSRDNEQNEQGSVFDLMLDAGCGGGESTRMFAPYFKNIVGFDPSKGMVALARGIPHSNNITYEVGSGEEMPAENESADLVAVGFAAQYMDIAKFTSECNRVLKPDGCAVIYGYMHHDIELLNGGDGVEKSGKDLLDTYQSRVRAFFNQSHPAASIVYARYQPIYDQVQGMTKSRIDDVMHEAVVPLDQFRKYYESIPPFVTFFESEIAKGNTNPLDELIGRLQKRWNVTHMSETEIKIRLTSSIYMVCLTKN